MREFAGRWLFAALVAFAALGCSKSGRDERVLAEVAAREAYARGVAIDAGAARMLNVASRSDVMFELGFSPILYDPPDDFHNHAFRWMGKNGQVRLHPHDDKPMKLRVGGWVNEKVIHAKPVISLYLDGLYVDTTGTIESGHWHVEKSLPIGYFRGREWVDLEIRCNAIGFHWGEPPELKVLVLYEFVWTEADG